MIKKLIVYKIFNILCQHVKYKVSRKLLVFLHNYLNVFTYRIIRETILCKKNHIIHLKNGDDLHIFLVPSRRKKI